MNPVSFKEQTTEIAKNQDEYITLPAYVEQDEMGQVISCWKLSLIERLQILFLGRIWLSVCAFGKPVSPVRLWSKSPFIKREDNNNNDVNNE